MKNRTRNIILVINIVILIIIFFQLYFGFQKIPINNINDIKLFLKNYNEPDLNSEEFYLSLGHRDPRDKLSIIIFSSIFLISLLMLFLVIKKRNKNKLPIIFLVFNIFILITTYVLVFVLTTILCC